MHVLDMGFKNGQPKDMCLKEVGLHAHNILTIMGLVVNVIEWT